MSSKKYAVLNSLLCLVITLLVFENYETWNISPGGSPNAGCLPNESEIKNEILPQLGSPGDPATVQSYNLISGNNIFNPERKEFFTSAAAANAPMPIAPPQIILYGVAIAGDYQSATVVKPGNPLLKGKAETQILKIGEQIGGYKLAKILPDRIAMEGNGQTFEILLYDSRNTKKRVAVKTENTPALVASTRPALASPLGESPKSTSSQEAVEKPKEPVQTRIASLPYNKYTYQYLGSSARSAVINRGTIFYSAFSSSAQ